MSANPAASMLGWWQEAGVDTIVGETPRDWLDPKPKKAAAEALAAPPPDALPDTIEAFHAWLAETDTLPFAGATRAPPAGNPGAALMVLADMPSEDGGLISGEAGALFDRMLGAMELTRAAIYLAPLSPVRAPTGRLATMDAATLTEIARHHVGLAAPKVLLLFGDICSKALLGSAVAGARGRWHALQTAAGPVRTMATLRPEQLIDQPGLKKFVWEDLQLVIEELKR